jgi:hypothetical protein
LELCYKLIYLQIQRHRLKFSCVINSFKIVIHIGLQFYVFLIPLFFRSYILKKATFEYKPYVHPVTPVLKSQKQEMKCTIKS